MVRQPTHNKVFSPNSSRQKALPLEDYVWFSRMESKRMPKDSLDLITQEQLSIGTDLMENASLARRLCKTYMQELERRLTLGGTIEPGPLTFKSEQMSVCHTYC